MKRYSIGIPYHGQFQYINKTDNLDETIEKYKNSRMQKGLQIYDNNTNEIIFSELRPVKGVLTLTFTNGEKVWESKQEFVNLDYMEERECFYKQTNYGFSVVKIEKQVF